MLKTFSQKSSNNHSIIDKEKCSFSSFLLESDTNSNSSSNALTSKISKTEIKEKIKKKRNKLIFT